MPGVLGLPSPLRDLLLGPAPAMSVGRAPPPVPLFGPTGRQVGLTSPALGIRSYHVGPTGAPRMTTFEDVMPRTSTTAPIQNSLGYPKPAKVTPEMPDRSFSVREYPVSAPVVNITPTENPRPRVAGAAAGGKPRGERGVWATGGITQY